MSTNMVNKAIEVAELMKLAGAIGASAHVADTGEVSLVGASNEPMRIGGSVAEGVAYLKRATAPASNLHHGTAN